MKKIKSKKLGTAVFFILLAACLCGSVYLNWFFGGKTSESAKTLGETKYVGAEAKDPVERYFADARIERQATYDKTDIGVVTWDVELQPGEVRTFTVTYSVKHPTDREIAW